MSLYQGCSANSTFQSQQEKAKTRHPYHYQKKHLVQYVELGVRIDLIP
jgi:hypothetical protein